MPAIIGAFATLKPAPKTATGSSSARPQTTATTTATTGVAPWVSIVPNRGLTISTHAPVKGQAGPSGGSSQSKGQVPVGNYTGYRNVIDSLWANNPAAFSQQDWALNFQVNTTFDQNVEKIVGDSPVTFAPDGQLLDQWGNTLAYMIWFTVTIPVVRLLSISSSYQDVMALTPGFTLLWVSALPSAAASATSAPAPASPARSP